MHCNCTALHKISFLSYITDRLRKWTKFVWKKKLFNYLLQLEPPFKQDYENFINNRQLEQVEASGDQARMNQVSQALSSLMDVRLPLDENSTYDEVTTSILTCITFIFI